VFDYLHILVESVDKGNWGWDAYFAYIGVWDIADGFYDCSQTVWMADD